MKLTRLVLLITLMHGAVAFAQKLPAACSLLTSSEINAAIAVKAGPPHETDIVIPSGPSKGEPVNACMWVISDQGMVSISVIRAPSGPRREAAIARLHEATDKLKAQGWTWEAAKIGGAQCGTLVPPKAQSEQAAVGVGCIGEAKGFALSMSSMIKHNKVPPEKVKTLLDAAVKRLP